MVSNVTPLLVTGIGSRTEFIPFTRENGMNSVLRQMPQLFDGAPDMPPGPDGGGCIDRMSDDNTGGTCGTAM